MFKLYGISGDVSAKISNCMVVLFCVSREFKHNIRCKKVAQYARTKRDQSPRNQPEILFAMLQGNYTTQSYPYSVDGWLRHLIKGRSCASLTLFHPSQIGHILNLRYSVVPGMEQTLHQGCWGGCVRTHLTEAKTDSG